MASTDALPIPRKNVAYRMVFPILDADGDLVTGAAGLDSEVSKDMGTFTDCTNEATEIATSSGMYYLDLTSTEMNADSVAVIVKTSTTGAKTTPIVLYPLEDGDWRVNVVQLLGTAWATPNTAGLPDVNAKQWNALTTVALPLVPTTAGRTLDVSTGGEAGVDWANIGSPTTTVALTGSTIATTQKVDIETIKTQAVTAAAGVTVPATIASATNITAGTITTVTNLTNAPTAGDLTATMKTSVTTAATASTPVAASVTGNVGGNVTGSVGSVASGGITAASIASAAFTSAKFANDTGLASIRSSTATAGAGTTITLDASASSVDSFYVNDLIYLVSGTGVGQARFINGYVGSTKVATVPTWTTNPDNTTVFTILPFGATAGSTGLDAAATRAALGMASANMDTQLGTLATASALSTVAGYVDTEVAAIKAKTDNLPTDPADASDIAAAVAALHDLSAAQVNAEVVDALNVDTYAEPTGAPGATVSLATKIGYIFTALRNKLSVTATTKTFYNDSGTSLWTKTLSDDGTTYNETEGS